jgi:hypothetical protein
VTTPDDSYDLALAAASLRSSTTDVHVLLKALSDQLADTLGDRLRVQRDGGRFKKSGVITSLQVTMANDQFEAVVEGGTLHCVIGHSSGGIRIRSESLDMDEWLTRLLGALRDEAAHSEAARRALENIVIGGHQ